MELDFNHDFTFETLNALVTPKPDNLENPKDLNVTDVTNINNQKEDNDDNNNVNNFSLRTSTGASALGISTTTAASLKIPVPKIKEVNQQVTNYMSNNDDYDTNDYLDYGDNNYNINNYNTNKSTNNNEQIPPINSLISTTPYTFPLFTVEPFKISQSEVEQEEAKNISNQQEDPKIVLPSSPQNKNGAKESIEDDNNSLTQSYTEDLDIINVTPSSHVVNITNDDFSQNYSPSTVTTENENTPHSRKRKLSNIVEASKYNLNVFPNSYHNVVSAPIISLNNAPPIIYLKEQSPTKKIKTAPKKKKRINYSFMVYRTVCQQDNQERLYCEVFIQGKLQETVRLKKGKRGRYSYSFFDKRKGKIERRYWPAQSTGPVQNVSCSCNACISTHQRRPFAIKPSDLNVSINKDIINNALSEIESSN